MKSSILIKSLQDVASGYARDGTPSGRIIEEAFYSLVEQIKINEVEAKRGEERQLMAWRRFLAAHYPMRVFESFLNGPESVKDEFFKWWKENP